MKEALYIKFSMILFHFRNNHVHFLFKKCYHLVVKNTACFEIAGFREFQTENSKTNTKGRTFLRTSLCINSQTIEKGLPSKNSTSLIEKENWLCRKQSIKQLIKQTNL